MKKVPTITRIVLSVLLLIVGSTVSFAQENVFHLSEQISNQGDGTYSIERLTVGIVPTNFYTADGSHLTDGTPIRMNFDASVLSAISSIQNDLDAVEIIIINFHNESDFNYALPNLSQFSSLKYIYYNCFFELCGPSGTTQCEKQVISNHFNGNIEGVQLLYSAELPN